MELEVAAMSSANVDPSLVDTIVQMGHVLLSS